MRALAVDHGEKRIGIAVSDPTGTLARPLGIIKHVSRAVDAGRVLEFALENQAALIVIGQSMDEEGFPNSAGRRALRFAEALRGRTEIPVIMWDESLTTQDARAARIASGMPRKRRSKRVDSLAASIILQSYLDASQNLDSGKAESWGPT
jgi:putative Holliday junction resolvase